MNIYKICYKVVSFKMNIAKELLHKIFSYEEEILYGRDFEPDMNCPVSVKSYDETHILLEIFGIKIKFPKREYSKLKKQNPFYKYKARGVDITKLPPAQGRIRDIQLANLVLLKELDYVCRQSKLSYWLDGGTLLGAVRHKGFIPWDDDLDITMTREDYERFQSIFEGELGSDYMLKAPSYKNGSRSRFPKVMKKGTVFREVGNPSPDEECGIFLDIFILDNVPDNKLLRTVKGTICNLLEFISGQVLWHEEHADELLDRIKEAGKLQYYIRKVTGFLFSFRKAAAWNRTIDQWIQYKKDTKYCSLATGRKHYFGETLPRGVFLPGTKGIFEGKEILLFSDVDAYLTNLYGDYMVIPEESKREAHALKDIRF